MATQATNQAKAKNDNLKKKASLLLDRAYDMACDDSQGGAIQLGAMKLFLSKVLPDLKAVDYSGDIEISGQSFIFRKPD